jgi:hypothetical protein
VFLEDAEHLDDFSVEYHAGCLVAYGRKEVTFYTIFYSISFLYSLRSCIRLELDTQNNKLENLKH